MSKIFFITPSMKNGGGNRVFVELANRLSPDYNVSIIYPNNSKEKAHYYIAKSVEIMAIGDTANNKITKIINIYKTVCFLNKQEKDDIVILSDPILGIFSSLIKKCHVYRYIQADDYRIFDDGMILGNGLKLKLYKYFTKKSFLYKKINFIFVSNFTYKQFLKFSCRKDVKMEILTPSIDEKFKFDQIKHCHSDGFIYICSVARRHPLKGLKTLIDAYKILPTSVVQMIKIYLITQDDLSSFDTKGMIIIRPQKDEDIVDAYNMSDIFISTSWYEGHPLPPMEAMACGCACILSDSGGVKQYATDKLDCLMYPAKNEKMLADYIVELTRDNILRENLKERGLRTAKSFSWDKSVEQLINIINIHK